MVHCSTSRRSKAKAKTILRLPDLEQSKTAVLHSLGAASSQESYRHAIDEFIGWYCSEPRLAFNRTVVLRYRFFLEQKNLAPSTINVRLAAVRRLAYEASDTGLLSPELAAGIRRVKGAKRLGVRIGNWLSVEQARDLLRAAGSGDCPRQARPCDSCVIDCMRAPPCGACRVEERRFSASGRPLGSGGPSRQWEAYSHRFLCPRGRRAPWMIGRTHLAPARV